MTLAPTGPFFDKEIDPNRKPRKPGSFKIGNDTVAIYGGTIVFMNYQGRIRFKDVKRLNKWVSRVEAHMAYEDKEYKKKWAKSK